MMFHTKKILKAVVVGAFGSITLIIVNWLILFATTKDFNHPLQQFIQYKFWLATLIIGFGVQVGLFWYIRSGLHLSSRTSRTAVATGTGVSTVAMIACCTHHLVDFLPFLGFSVVALVLTQYQIYFFMIGIVSNVVGIIIMVYIIIKNQRGLGFRKTCKTN